MTHDPIGASHIRSEILQAQKAAQAQMISRYAIIQEVSEEAFTEWSELAAFNPLAIARRFESLETKVRRKGKEEETEKSEGKDKGIAEVKRLERVSEQFQRKNPELQTRSLLLLRAQISKGDTKEDILRKVLSIYPDYSLADEALDFLLETTEGELAEAVRAAKEELNARFGREVRAGRNIGAQAREFSKEGLGTATGLRDMYRDITRNPRDAVSLFEQLAANFSYEKMKKAIDFILHSLGSDMKSKGPSIDRGELFRLLTEARNMQAILGVYRFFNSRMRLISSAFTRQGLPFSAKLSFEQLSKQFVQFLKDRFPSPEKALQMAEKLGIAKELLAQSIIYTQMRDAVRQVAPKLFQNDQHRAQVLKTFQDTLEKIDEQLEEDEEKDRKKKDDEEEKK